MIFEKNLIERYLFPVKYFLKISANFSRNEPFTEKIAGN